MFSECFLLLLLLHLHKIVEGLYFQCSLSVSLCVYVCVIQTSGPSGIPFSSGRWVHDGPEVLDLCLCVCVCVCLCVRHNFFEQNSIQKDAPIWTRFSLNCCFLHWLKPYRIWWPCVKGKGHSDVIPIFLHNSLLNPLPCISALLCLIKIKFDMSLRSIYTFGRYVFEFNKIQIGDDVIMTSFKFSPNNCPYL